MASSTNFLLTTLALFAFQVIASDPSPLQDFCVADKDSNGENPPHTHPRATEILTVLEGTLYVGFVTSNTDNKLFSKMLNKGDVFVFPEGLVHFQFNPCPDKPAVAIAALSSQNPGVITIANAVFGSKPPISDDVLAKAFQVEKMTIDWLQAQFWGDNHN
ncbi:hypothetical protein PR202_gb28620 [Eleusine coracana subsp. coracana]|uniref:Germin-like protein n=1 Tax=Eleusine coracana subsp. coracana TaxID=191504 RepID=A0AAV5FXA6_ELECO|nr:hypothetical protein PR202_gb28620 [Eleusine coracana subsp. coracana]